MERYPRPPPPPFIRRGGYYPPVRDYALDALARTDPEAAASIMKTDRMISIVIGTGIVLCIGAAVIFAIIKGSSSTKPVPAKSESP
jgi:hypothetical protein